MSEEGQGCPMVVLCIDRLYVNDMRREAQRHFGTRTVDIHTMPGAAKAIASERWKFPWNRTHLKDIAFGVEHHGTSWGAVISHTRCGKYPKFRTKSNEVAALEKDLRTARHMLQRRLRNLKVDLFIYDVDSGKLIPVSD